MWCFNYSTGKISTSFLMANSKSNSEYCAFGNGEGVIFEIAKKFGAYELEKNYPKNFGLYQSFFYRGDTLPMTIKETDRYFPFKLININTKTNNN